MAALIIDGKRVHDYRVRTGIREARFAVDGFFLNGRRLQLFGLNRHEIYPYAGGAMPGRVLRRDAAILRRDFNCNIVRCSHYPQSEAFLDACDELGLMVWEETPGWGYLGDPAWKELVVENVHDMICRDRNHPAIVIWGVRVNESANDAALYQRTTGMAKALDGSRATSGSMTTGSRKNWERDWHEDVFAFDDYHSDPDGSVGIERPTPGVPYLLAEAVGQFNYTKGKGFDAKYRRAGDVVLQEQQALRHAQAHSKAAAYPACSGVIAWCAFDYASLVNPYDASQMPGRGGCFPHPKTGRDVLSGANGMQVATGHPARFLLGFRTENTSWPRQKRRHLFQLRPAGSFRGRPPHRHAPSRRGRTILTSSIRPFSPILNWTGPDGRNFALMATSQAGGFYPVPFPPTRRGTVSSCKRTTTN